ncbi:RNA-binding domain-containing protein [Westerdykella ornata]|uniref:RNA-binding domain-containing protein n=1 Tax=Westerdykella ornata TaxID=318751 RepID=A0A6A6JSL9_WESOR|nr:RNA-binding domain-containing protein [Westerdykella ornata]KAF2279600.1 RNA-binding domain-containing protein [Westerdykella ornata]
MNTIRAIQRLNKRELEAGINPEGSWHTDYRDTAFIYVGDLPFDLSEGDIITIFSQYGEPVWIKLARDKETGKSRGFCWLKYEDQRSTDLAVDNLGGAQVLGRTLRVDHARYKPRDDEDMRDNTMGDVVEEEPEKKRRRRGASETETETESEEERPLLKEELELRKLIRELDDDDPMKGALVKRKREEAESAVAKYEKARRKEKERARRHDRRRDRSKDRRRDKSKDREYRPRSRSRDSDSGHRDRSSDRNDRRRNRSRDRYEYPRNRSKDRSERRRSSSRDRYNDRRHRDRD